MAKEIKCGHDFEYRSSAYWELEIWRKREPHLEFKVRPVFAGCESRAGLIHFKWKWQVVQVIQTEKEN